MNRQDVKEVMEQIHISETMQEEIIMKVRERMEKGNHKSTYENGYKKISGNTYETGYKKIIRNTNENGYKKIGRNTNENEYKKENGRNTNENEYKKENSRNINENGYKGGDKNTGIRNWKKIAMTAAVFVLVAGVVSFPARAFVSSVVRERMENIPEEEVQEIQNMIGQQRTEADGFSREYTDGEEERSQELWQAYKEGQFPENVIAQVDHTEDAPEGTLCYIRTTGVFQLPEHEMTDEEILEIIDFQHKMSYAVEQSPAAQESRTQMQAEKNQMRDEIQAAGGISEEEAIEIATKQMEAELGEDAEGKEILKYEDGSAAVIMQYISGQEDHEHKGDIAYNVIFCDPDDDSTYYCIIDAMDGSILNTYE